MDITHWPPGAVLKHYIDAARGCPPSLDPAAAEAQIAASPRPWCAVANVFVVRTDDPREANVLSVWDPSVYQDNPYYLAETGEPVPGGPTQLYMRLDPTPAAGWTLDRLRKATLHEFGHALGEEHSPPGVPSAMSAELDESIDGLTPYDIASIQSKYGPAGIAVELPDGGRLVYTPPAAPPAPPDPEKEPQVYAPSVIDLPDGSQLELRYIAPPRPVK